jgi:hypothetical protein
MAIRKLLQLNATLTEAAILDALVALIALAAVKQTGKKIRCSFVATDAADNTKVVGLNKE